MSAARLATAPAGVTDTREYHEVAAAYTGEFTGDLARAAALVAAASDYRARLVLDARRAGMTWAAIGAELGVTMQAAQQLAARYKRSGGRI